MNDQTVFAEWHGYTFHAAVNVYGVATISSDSRPVQTEAAEAHEVARFEGEGGAVNA